MVVVAINNHDDDDECVSLSVSEELQFSIFGLQPNILAVIAEKKNKTSL